MLLHEARWRQRNRRTGGRPERSGTVLDEVLARSYATWASWRQARHLRRARRSEGNYRESLCNAHLTKVLGHPPKTFGSFVEFRKAAGVPLARHFTNGSFVSASGDVFK